MRGGRSRTTTSSGSRRTTTPLEPDATPADTAKALGGRATELVGIITDDDETIARGKTQHAEAAESAALDQQEARKSAAHDE